MLILGDSQAAQLWYGLHETYPDVNFLQATAFACPLFLMPRDPVSPACHDLAAYLHSDFPG